MFYRPLPEELDSNEAQYIPGITSTFHTLLHFSGLKPVAPFTNMDKL